MHKLKLIFLSSLVMSKISLHASSVNDCLTHIQSQNPAAMEEARNYLACSANAHHDKLDVLTALLS